MSDGVKDPDEKCAACDHTREHHGDGKRCSACPCYGFFPAGGRYCENPTCDGSGCKSNRPSPEGERGT